MTIKESALKCHYSCKVRVLVLNNNKFTDFFQEKYIFHRKIYEMEYNFILILKTLIENKIKY